MPWGNKTVEEKREEFLELVQSSGNMSRACREMGITRRTGYKWVERSQKGEPLKDRSRAPKRIANKTDDATQRLILSVREENPSWGGRLIHDYLISRGHEALPCPRTCCNILKRHGCIDEKEVPKHRAYQRFEREHCNELWQTDFKGDFLLHDGSRCYPLTILDDHSRYSISIDCKAGMSGVKDSFRRAFCEYGVPQSVLSDNGAQFAGYKGGYTRFERWLMEHDVLPIHGRFMHPQTQGKIERFHRTMKHEFLKYQTFENLQDVTAKLGQWRVKYNEQRPHLALNSKCPAEVYIPCERSYTDEVKPFEYDNRTYKVNNRGYLRFAHWQIFLSETMADTKVEVTQSPHGDSFCIYFRNFKIAEVDAHNGNLINRKVYRR